MATIIRRHVSLLFGLAESGAFVNLLADAMFDLSQA
jgi:hypothetical protein